MFGLRMGAMGAVGAGSPLNLALLAIFRRPGVEAHAYIPGVGTIGGLALQNYIMEDGTQALTVDQPWGYAGDPVSTMGAELVTNGDFSVDASWTKGAGWTISGGAATHAAGASSDLSQAVSLTGGRSYQTTFTVSGYTGSGNIRPRFYGGTTSDGSVVAGNGTYTQVITANAGNSAFAVTVVSTAACSIDNISVRELVGAIPARQATTANKPILRRGWVNRCLYSQDFSNAGWSASNDITKVSTSNADPLGNPTAVLIQSGSLTTPHLLTAPVFSSFTAGLVYTQTVFIKAGTVSRCQLTFSSTPFGSDQYANFSLTGSGSVLASAGGTASIETSTNGYYRCRFTATCTTSGSGASTAVVFINSDAATRTPSYAGNAADNLLVAFAQLETGSTANPYVPTTTAAASASTGPFWAEYDGTDFLTLAAVPFQQADDHCVVVAAATQSTAAQYVFAIGNSSANFPSVANLGFQTNGQPRALWRDDANVSVSLAMAVSPPALGAISVLAAQKSGASRRLRVNGATIGSSTTVLGATSTSGGAAIGRFPTGGSVMLGGIYPVIAIKGTITDAELSTIERWIAAQSGVTLP